MSDKSEFDFRDLEPVEESIWGPDGQEYLLKEASGGAGKRYKNERTKGLHFAGGELSQLEGAGNLEPLLVSLCLWRVTGRSESGQPVLLSMADKQPYIEKTFTASQITKIYNRAYEISDLAEGNPTGDAIKLALDRNDSPIAYKDLKDFIDEKCVGKDYKAVQVLFKEDPSKNSPKSTTDGLE